MRITLPSGTEAEIAGDPSAMGLVITPDIFGLRPLFDDMVARLSSEWSMTVIAVEPFPGLELGPDVEPRMAAMSNLDDAIHLRDLKEAADATGCDRVGLLGFCMGGMYAMLAGWLDEHGFPRDEAQRHYLLDDDVELNSQGIEIWLDRK